MIATLRRSSRATKDSVVVNGFEVAIGGRSDNLSVPGNARVDAISRKRNQVLTVEVARHLCDLHHVNARLSLGQGQR